MPKKAKRSAPAASSSSKPVVNQGAGAKKPPQKAKGKKEKIKKAGKKAKKPPQPVEDEGEDDDVSIAESEAFGEGDDEKYGDILRSLAQRKGGAVGSLKEDPVAEDDDDDAGDDGAMLLSDLFDNDGAGAVSDGEGELDVDATDLLNRLEPAAEPEKRRNAFVGLAESSAGLTDVAGASTEDILASLEGDVELGELKKQLKGLSQDAPLRDAGGSVKQARESRKVRYEAATKLANRWMPQIQHNRTKEQVVLGKSETKLNSQEKLITEFEAQNDFEKEVEEAAKAAGLAEADVKEAAALPADTAVAQEKQRQQVMRLKTLMMREASRNKRINKIKSKTYHRIKNKAEMHEREKLLERLEVENPEMATKLKEEYEQKYAKMRLWRQQKARAKWSITANRFGGKDMRQEITKQAQNMHNEKKALERMVKGRGPKDADDSSSDEEVDVSDDEPDGAAGSLQKAKLLTLKELKRQEEEDESTLPQTGLFGLKFMKEAIKQQRQEAKESAEKLLGELNELEGANVASDSDAENEASAEQATASDKPKAKKARELTKEEELAAEAEVQAALDGDDLALSVEAPQVKAGGALSVSNKKVLRGLKESRADAAAAEIAKTAAATAAPVDPANPWTSGGWEALADGDAPADGKAEEAADGAAEEEGTTKRRKQKKREADAFEAEQKARALAEAGDCDDDTLFAPVDREDTSQRDLIQQVFSHSAVDDEDFMKEKGDKGKDSADDDELPGWGCWAGDGVKARKRKKSQVQKVRDELQDKPMLKHVQYFEGLDKKAGRYCVPDVPRGYNSADQYEASLKQPIGPDWNCDSVHRHMIKPQIVTRVGAVVKPLEYHKHLSVAEKDTLIGAWNGKKRKTRTMVRL